MPSDKSALCGERCRGKRASSRPRQVPLPAVRRKQRPITVTNYSPVLDRFIAKTPGYAPLIDSGNPGNWP
jgi:hypothetical protein